MSSIYGPGEPDPARVPVTAEADAWAAPIRSWQLRLRPWLAGVLALAAVVRFVLDPEVRYVGAFVALAASAVCWWQWLRGSYAWAWRLGALVATLVGLWLVLGP